MDGKRIQPLERQPKPVQSVSYNQAYSPQPRYAHPHPVMQQPPPQQQQQQQQQQSMGQQVQYISGQPGVAQAGQQQPTVVFVNAGPMELSENPVPMTCIHCHANIITNVEYKSGMYTWTLVFLCCILLCILGCCIIPLYYDACKDVEHSCPSCKNRIGIWRRNEAMSRRNRGN